jgi:hypothetical protein
MSLKEIYVMARKFGIKCYKKLNKESLIRAIQSIEGNSPCYKNIKSCGQIDCLWRKECQKS